MLSKHIFNASDLASGASDDWVKGILNVPYVYTVELADKGHYGFVLPHSFIQPTAEEMTAALQSILEDITD